MTAKNPKIAIFPGTFDPMTNGHLDLIRRGRDLFDRLVVAIGHNPEKSALFTLDERLHILSHVIKDADLDVEVQTFTGLTVDFARTLGATALLRGIRNIADLQFELQLALTNRTVADVETVFIMAGDEYAFASSSLIKQIAAGGKLDRLSRLLPSLVVEKLREKFEAGALSLTDIQDPAKQ